MAWVWVRGNGSCWWIWSRTLVGSGKGKEDGEDNGTAEWVALEALVVHRIDVETGGVTDDEP